MTNLFYHLLSLSRVISAMIAVVIIIRLVLTNAPKRLNKILWIIVGIRSCIPFSIKSSVGLLPDKAVPYTLSNNGIVSTGIPDITPSIPRAVDGVANVSHSVSIKDILPGIWGAGMVLFLLYLIFSYVRTNRLVSEAIPYRKNIFESDRICSPFVMGYFKPRIYIQTGSDSTQRELIIAHEECHLKHKDNFLKLIGFLILGVYWFNPLMWVAYFFFCKDIELACDEAVIKSLPFDTRKEYAIALLGSSHRNMILTSGVAFSEKNVKERVENVMNYKKAKFWVITAAALICVVILAAFFTVSKEGKASTPDYVTYEFETFDGESVVIDENNITIQEKTDDPESSEYISEAAAENIIAPGRDYVYLADDDNYYVADYYNGLITVASKNKASDTDPADGEEILDDNPGYLESDVVSVEYDTQKFYGYKLDDGTDTIVLNSTTATAGTSLIQISNANSGTIEGAVAEISGSTGFSLAPTKEYDLNGYKAVSTNHVFEDDAEGGVIIDDYYIIAENNGKVIIIDEMITRDSDAGRKTALEKEFADALSTIKFK